MTQKRIRTTIPAAQALVGGALTAVSFTEGGSPLAALVGLALLYAILSHSTPRQNTLRALLFCAAFHSLATYWVAVAAYRFSESVGLSIFLTSIAWGFGILVTVAMLRLFHYGALLSSKHGTHHSQANAITRALLFAACWTVAEWLRSWLLGGFPSVFIGVSQLESPLAHWAPLLGVYGVTFTTVMIAALLSTVIQQGLQRRTLAVAPLTVIVSLLAASILLSQVRWTTPTGRLIDAVVVQPNLSASEKWDTQKFAQHIAHTKALTEPYWFADVIVWPETAIPAFTHNVKPLLTELDQKATLRSAALLVGIATQEPTHLSNVVMGLGTAKGEVSKTHLVPFAEELPWYKEWKDVYTSLGFDKPRYQAGTDQAATITANGLQFAVAVCFDIAYPPLSGHSTSPDLLIEASNNAWFDDTPGLDQFVQMARMRALEAGRPLLRSTNSGVSVLVGPDGEILSQLKSNTAGALRGTVPVMQGATPFMRLGGHWAVTCIVLFTVMVLGLNGLLARRSTTR